MSEIRITNHRNGRVTISGLTHGDLRLVARAIGDGSFSGGDHGGPVSRSLLRLADALRVPTMYPSLHTPVRLSAGRSTADDNFHEFDNRPELFEPESGFEPLSPAERQASALRSDRADRR